MLKSVPDDAVVAGFQLESFGFSHGPPHKLLAMNLPTLNN